MIKYNLVDLFAGAGGLSLGFLKTNKFNISLAVEINKYMQETYKRNHKGVRVESDIIEVVKNIDNIKNDIKDVDVVIGGPPCQGFSNANRQRNSLISNNNKLVKEYIKFIQIIQPKAFVFENVKTIISDKHKFFVEKEDFETISNLNLRTKVEEIKLGPANFLSTQIVDYVNTIGINDLEQFLLKSEVFTEINSIIKNPTKSIKKICKLEKIIDKWDKLHEYINDDYYDQWKKIKENYIIGEYEHCIQNIINVVEVQKIINKLNEVFIHNIDWESISVRNNDVIIKLKTYNVYEFIIESLIKTGYLLDKGILNAVNFGVPQTRERLIIIGVRKDLISNTLKEVKLPKPLYLTNEEYTTVYNAIGDLESLEPDKETGGEAKKRMNIQIECPKLYNNFIFDTERIYNHINTSTREIALKRFSLLAEGENFHNLSDEYKQTYSNPARTQNTVYKRLKYDTQCGTVVNVRKSMWIHPKHDRALSIREAARLQSFPDSYIFEGTKDAQYQQVGNAVPPLLGKAIAEKVLELLK